MVSETRVADTESACNEPPIMMQYLPDVGRRRLFEGLIVGAASFAVLGTVAALWDNPIFVRMTPSGPVEIVLLAALAALAGIYTAVRRPFCAVGGASAGGIAGFLGIACPVCNKVLLAIFGWDLLMTYYEPARLYVAALGVVMLAVAVAYELRQRARLTAEAA